ncbi:MAG: hypothetical protein K2X93_24510 [Candidatus Obscuribacterales bacterium]|nr:hypothetical protein [Candidatus Obscuribacterales bacterium]
MVASVDACLNEDLRLTAIPLRKEGAASAHDYHDVEIALQHELGADPLVDVRELGLASDSIYARDDGLNAPYFKKFHTASKKIYLRHAVAKKLVDVNQALEPYQVELYLLDGYRPIELQVEVWDDFVEQARRVLPNPTEDECARYAGYYCSDPRSFDESNFKTWPTHSTGGAIDLSLRAIANKEPLFFGSIFDDATEISYTDHFERNESKNDGASIVEARRNRRLLYWVMTNAGFANYPYEWWHFDWGTQMWVVNSGDYSRVPVFGYAKRPAAM